MSNTVAGHGSRKMKLIEKLGESDSLKWRKIHNNKDLSEAYKDVCAIMEPYIEEAERGALLSEIKSYRDDLINKVNNGELHVTSSAQVQDILENIPLLFLNKHGEDHISCVIDKANEISSFFTNSPLSSFESFILLCAIQIHDVGNILGREHHELKQAKIFDDNVKKVIKDTCERRVIESIAMAHGGRGPDGSKDTISFLQPAERIFEERVRTRELAAILRLADELADDSTRYSYGALELDIIEDYSKIKHDYSRVLHTVMIEKRDDGCCQIVLVYEMSSDDVKTTYSILGKDVFLLDEIYDRTLKMERERRYCSKFLNADIRISGIQVRINIYGCYCNLLDHISYTLEDFSYPLDPSDGSIKEISKDIRSGIEEKDFISRKEM